MSSKSSRGHLVFRSSLLYVWVTRGPFGRLPKSLCVTSVAGPLTRSSVELRPPSRRGPAFRQIVETTQGRPWDLEGTPSPGPQGLWTGARGSQGPSGRPATRGTPPIHVYMSTAGNKGLTRQTDSRRHVARLPPLVRPARKASKCWAWDTGVSGRDGEQATKAERSCCGFELLLGN